MTQEEKQLLLKDLCGRLPYGVMISVQGGEFDSYKYPYQLTAVSKFGLDSFCKVYHPIYIPFCGTPNVEDIKPYLRSMESMTDEEYDELCECGKLNFIGESRKEIDWLNAHHFDYRNLIECGLAIEVTEENNPYK